MRHVIVASTLAFVACAPASPSGRVALAGRAPTASTDRDAGEATDAAPNRDACAVAAIDDGLDWPAFVTSGTHPLPADAVAKHRPPCWPAKLGGWSLRAERPAERAEPGEHLAALVRLDAEGRVIAKRSLRAALLLDVQLYDYDGDADPEVFLSDSSWEGAALLSWKGGAIEDYAPARGLRIREMQDYTGDGRPDLVLHELVRGGSPEMVIYDDGHAGKMPPGGIAYYCAPSNGPPPMAETPELLAHALADGTFSTTDGAAREFATRSCPARPVGPTSPKDVGCARVWGAAERDVLAEIRRIKPIDCRDAKMTLFAGKDAPRGTAWRWDHELLVRMAKVAVPLTLP